MSGRGHDGGWKSRTRQAAGAPRASVGEPRNDPQAEQAVLGGILLDNAGMALVEPILAPEDFYVPAHGPIFEAMVALSARREPIDVVTVSAQLRSMSRLNAVGGAQYIGELTDTIPTIAHIESHARIVADHARVRRLVDVFLAGIAEASGGMTADELCAFAEARVMAATARRDERAMVPLADGLLEEIDRFEAVALGTQQPGGTTTGFDELDDLISRMHPGQSILIAARPAMGKSALVVNIAANAAEEQRKPVLIFSLEMPTSEVVRRMLASRGKIDQTMIRRGRLPADDTTRMFNAANDLHGLPVWIDDTAEITVQEIRAKCRRIKQKHGEIGLVVIDYLQLVRVARESRAGNREQEVSEISRSMKILAKEIGAPVITLSQLNRGPEERADHRPVLADLRESGAIEQDADVVMFIYRDVIYNKKTDRPDEAEIIVAKQRNGPTDTVRLRFVRPWALFESQRREEEVASDAGERADVDAGEA